MWNGSEVHRWLELFHHLVETTDLHIDDFKPRGRDHRVRPWPLSSRVRRCRLPKP